MGLAAVCLAMGCAADVGGSGKGAEDAVPLDGKADSFRRPSEHGTLSWGIPSRAELTGEALFHAWTFTLSAEGTFALETGGNLDTVLYLYHRETSESGWGRYVAKNDDAAADRVTSRIAFEDAPAGEYRIIVKGFKTNHRGPFEVLGTCDGRGCAGGGTCDESFPSFTGGRGWGPSCNAALLGILSSPLRTVTEPRDVEAPLVCNLSPIEARTVELYQGYWDSVYGWDEHVGAEETVTFEVEASEHEAGSVVRVGVYGLDEDRVVAAYDAEGALVMFWVDGQSVDEQWYCAADGEDAQAYGPSCTTDMFRSLPHHPGDVTAESGTATPDTALEDAGDFLGMALGEFAYAHDIAGTDEVAFDGETWRNADGLTGGQVTFRAAGHEATYTLMTTWDDHLVIAAVASDGATEVGCLELM